MLNLTRREQESIVIVIGGKVVATVMVCDVRGDSVRLGIEAEKTTEIHRQEVWQSKLRGEDRTPHKTIAERLKEKAAKMRAKAEQLEARAAE